MIKTLQVMITSSSLLLSFSISAEQVKKEKKVKAAPQLNIRELALPSEVQNIGKSAGSIYYSPSIKDKVLMPVHFWGEVSKSGLHFIPMDTNLIKGLSMAGGPRASSQLDQVQVTRKNNQKLETKHFNLQDGGDAVAHNYKLQPGDTVFIKKDDFLANRSYYTSLIGVLATTLSTILIFREVKRDRAGQ